MGVREVKLGKVEIQGKILKGCELKKTTDWWKFL